MREERVGHRGRRAGSRLEVVVERPPLEARRQPDEEGRGKDRREEERTRRAAPAAASTGPREAAALVPVSSERTLYGQPPRTARSAEVPERAQVLHVLLRVEGGTAAGSLPAPRRDRRVRAPCPRAGDGGRPSPPSPSTTGRRGRRGASARGRRDGPRPTRPPRGEPPGEEDLPLLRRPTAVDDDRDEVGVAPEDVRAGEERADRARLLAERGRERDPLGEPFGPPSESAAPRMSSPGR